MHAGEYATLEAPVTSEACGVGLACANADGLFDRRHENLGIPNAPHACCPPDRLDHLLNFGGIYHDLDLDFGHEQHRILRAPVDLCMTALPTEALDVGDSHALHAQGAQGLAN